MKTLLHIDSSANPRGSISHKLTAEFVSAWRAVRAGETVVYRDLDHSPIPSIDHTLMEALSAAPGTSLSEDQEKAVAFSDRLVDELFEADAYVFGVPMYNFSVPGVFKDYIDQVARKGRTLVPGPQGISGGLKGKKALIISTRMGDYGETGPRAGWDFHEPWLRKVLAYMGVEDVAYVPVIQNPFHGGAEEQARHLDVARAKLREVLRRWNAEEAETLRFVEAQSDAKAAA